MAKTISLSTDMTVIYFIDSTGFAQSFSLRGNGVYITSIVGEVHVVPASRSLQSGTDEFLIASKSQWDVVFHENTNQAMFIGEDDIDATLTGQIKKYDLSGGNTINVRLDSTQTKILIRS